MDKKLLAKQKAKLRLLGKDINEVYSKYFKKDRFDMILAYPMPLKEFCEQELGLDTKRDRLVKKNIDYLVNSNNQHVIMYDYGDHGTVWLMDDKSEGDWSGLSFKDTAISEYDLEKEDSGYYPEVEYLSKKDFLNQIDGIT